MPSIAEWLEELGLGEYTQRFAENGIDFSVLGHLSDQDLKDLGVLLGHRRKLQAAIGGVPGAAPAPPMTAAAPIIKPACKNRALPLAKAAPRAFREEYNESESTLVRTNSPLRRAPSRDPNPCHGATRLRSRRLR